MEEDIYIAIDRYLEKEMGSSERLAFEHQLENDSDLREKVDIYRSSKEILTAHHKHEDSESKFRQTITQLASEEFGTQHTQKPLWYKWAAAASVAMLCAILLYTSFSKPDYKDYTNYEPLVLTERGSNDIIKQKAQETFNDKDYQAAAVYLNTLVKHDPGNAEFMLYEGMALLELNKVKEATLLFNNVKSSESIYRDKAIWMLALVALKEKDYKTCETILKEIQPASPEYKNAQNLLEDL